MSSPRTIIKLRITADDESAATTAIAILEAALARYGCKLARPRMGSNPKYADQPKYLAYGDMVIAGEPPKRRRPRSAPRTQPTPRPPHDNTKG